MKYQSGLEVRTRPKQARRILLAGSIAGALLVLAGTWLLWLGIGQEAFGNSLERQVFQPPFATRLLTARTSQIIALRQDSPTTSPLLLFLPATGTSTQLYGSFEAAAANHGFHVLALPYANRRTEISICRATAACYGQLREEQLNGVRSGYLPPSATSASVESTLSFALDRLQKSDPNGGWGPYTPRDSIDWSKIVVAGHSQGGGLAAYIGHRHVLKGVIMFSSPNDVYLPTHTVGDWVTSPSATPLSRYYGLMDTHDYYSHTTRLTWGAMFPGLPINPVDGHKRFKGQLFSTSAAHFSAHLTAHFAVATDEAYLPVWNYFLQETY